MADPINLRYVMPTLKTPWVRPRGKEYYCCRPIAAGKAGGGGWAAIKSEPQSDFRIADGYSFYPRPPDPNAGPSP